MISVIIPNYNHAKFLQQRLNTVASQSLSDFECIILDDKSTDESEEIIKRFVLTDRRFSAEFNSSNSGSTFYQWNKGIAKTNRHFIWIAESDDAANKNLLKSLLKAILENPEVVLAYCQSHRMNEKNEVTGTWQDYTDDLDKERFNNDFVMDGKDYIERFLIHRNTIPNASAVVFRKDIYTKVGGAQEHLKTNGDWLTWLKMLCYGKVAFVAEPMNFFRYHSGSVIAKANLETEGNKYRERYQAGMRKQFNDFLKRYKVKISAKAKKNNDYFIALDRGNEGLFNIRHGQVLKGWKQILRASVFPTLQSGFIKKGIIRK